MDFSQDKTFPVGRTFVKHFLSDSRSGTKSNRTKFYVSYDEENLYFRFDCREEFFRPEHNEFNAPLYEGDIVELMLTLGEKTNISKWKSIKITPYILQKSLITTGKAIFR